MIQKLLVTALGLLLGLTPFSVRVDAAEPGARHNWWTATYECCCPPWFGDCGNDYCRKCSPTVPCWSSCFECDDYCRRQAPCVLRPQVTCADDYCRKSRPPACWPATTKALCVPYCDHACEPSTEPAPAACRSKILWIR